MINPQKSNSGLGNENAADQPFVAVKIFPNRWNRPCLRSSIMLAFSDAFKTRELISMKEINTPNTLYRGKKIAANAFL